MTSFRNIYLVVYNLIQTLGWAMIGAKLVPHCRALTYDMSVASAFEAVEPLLWPLQLSAYLELVHNLVGLVRGSPAVTFLQVILKDQPHLSCDFVTLRWVVVFQISFRVVNCWLYKTFAVAGNSPLCLLVLVSWTLTEVIRYPYYLTGLMNKKSTLLI